MGFIYKLTEDVVQFILDQKQKSPELSCRELVELVADGIQRDISKSSVHEVLKQAHLTTRRKYKNKFQIPAQKKAQLLAGLPPLPDGKDGAPTLLPDPGLKPRAVLPPPVAKPVKIQETLAPMQGGPAQAGAGAIFLKAAFWDLFPSPWRNVKTYEDLATLSLADLNKEWEYRTLQVANYKITLEDGGSFVIDARLQSLTQVNAGPQITCPIEHGLKEMADGMLNNLQPIIVKDVRTESSAALADFVKAFEGVKGKNISQIEVLDTRGQPLAFFSGLIPTRRRYIIGLDPQLIAQEQFANKSAEEIQYAPSYFYPPVRYRIVPVTVSGSEFPGLAILTAEEQVAKVVVTNILPAEQTSQAIVRQFVERHPLGQVTFPEIAAAFDSQMTHLERLREYVKALSGKSFSESDWQSILALTGETKFNEQANSTILLTQGLSSGFDLVQTSQLLNACGLKDASGRSQKIFLA